MSEFNGLWKHEETQHAPKQCQNLQLDEGGHLMKEEEEEITVEEDGTLTKKETKRRNIH